MNNKVLIIGGNGFIGKNIVNYLSRKNIEIGVYDLYENLDTNYNIEKFQGNIITDENFDKIIKKYDTIIYLITSVSPKKSMEFPDSSYVQDIPILLKTLNSCINNGIKRVIYASSGGTVYGEGNGQKLLETTQEEPINHYAIAKLSCEKILQLYNKLYQMENVILRISNPYGIGQNPKSGVGVITTFIEKIINNEEIILYGDGNITRDYIYIDAVCDAFYKSIIWNFDNKITPVFNVGSGEAISLNEIIKIISEELNTIPNIIYQNERPFDVKFNVLNIDKAKEILGYNPEDDEKKHIRKYIKEIKERNRGNVNAENRTPKLRR